MVVGWLGLVTLGTWRLFVLGNNLKFNSVTGLDINLPSFVWFLFVITLLGLGYVIFASSESYGHLSGFIGMIVGLFFMVIFGFTWLNLTAAVIFWLFNVWAEGRAIGEAHNRIKLDVGHALTDVIFPIVLGFFVIASFAAYQSSFVDQIKKSNELPGQTEVYLQQVTNSIFGSKLGPANSPERNQAVSDIAAGTFNSINEFLKPYFQWAPPALAFGLFLLLWGLSWIFVYAGVVVSLFVFWILKKIGVVKIAEKDVKAQVIVL